MVCVHTHVHVGGMLVHVHTETPEGGTALQEERQAGKRKQVSVRACQLHQMQWNGLRVRGFLVCTQLRLSQGADGRFIAPWVIS